MVIRSQVTQVIKAATLVPVKRKGEIMSATFLFIITIEVFILRGWHLIARYY